MQRGFIQRRIITLLITGTVLTAGLIMGFGGYVFAGDPVEGLDITIGSGDRVSDKIYDSSFSKTKSIGLVRKEVGDVLLRYGVGGADINKVTEALEDKGVYEAELKRFLLAIGMNEKDAQDILLEFDKIGIGTTGGTLPSASEGKIKDILPSKQAEPASATIKLMQDIIGKIQERLKDCDNIEVCDIVERHAKGRADVTDTTKKAIENRNWEEATRLLREVRSIIVGDIKLLEGVEDKDLIADVLGLERALLHQTDVALKTEILSMSLSTRENAQDLRENFRERAVREKTDKIEKLEIARIAVAHGKGLRMINRYRSAIARFDHILGRLESRIEKLEERGADVSSITVLIEEAKNMQVGNEAKMEELKAKYESLLLGENPGGVAQEAREIAKELKSEIENLHAKLREIAIVISGFTKTTPTYEPEKSYSK